MAKLSLPFLAFIGAFLFFSSAPAPAAPSWRAPSIDIASPVESVRWRWRRHVRNERPAGIALFTVPGLYWGPAWWDSNYARLCWRQIQPCTNCARNWAYTC